MRHWKTALGFIFVLPVPLVFFYLAIRIPSGSTVAVSQPIVLSPGHTEVAFHTNYPGRHRIAIEFDEPKKIQFSPRDCITEEGFQPGDCNAIHAGFTGTWTLASNGRVVQQGTIPATLRQMSGPFSSSICVFQAKRSATYKFALDILSDGSRLAPAQPHLDVYVWQPEFGETQFMYKLIKAATYFAAVLSLFIGFLLLIMATWPTTRS
jgi:hypothetical protein